VSAGHWFDRRVVSKHVHASYSECGLQDGRWAIVSATHQLHLSWFEVFVAMVESFARDNGTKMPIVGIARERVVRLHWLGDRGDGWVPPRPSTAWPGIEPPWLRVRPGIRLAPSTRHDRRMVIHRVSRERACEIVREHVDTDKLVSVVARNAVEWDWLEEELEECGVLVDVLTRGTWEDEIIALIESGDAEALARYCYDEVDEMPDVAIIIEDGPTVVRRVPVA
jgi:hypothetical protein